MEQVLMIYVDQLNNVHRLFLESQVPNAKCWCWRHYIDLYNLMNIERVLHYKKTENSRFLWHNHEWVEMHPLCLSTLLQYQWCPFVLQKQELLLPTNNDTQRDMEPFERLIPLYIQRIHRDKDEKGQIVYE